MTPLPLPSGFAADASWLVQAIDPAASLARLIRMTPEAYRQASFLDDRMLAPDLDARVCSLADIAGSADSLPAKARWIFHIGHVGSTLIARLLGEGRAVLSVREPRALRDLLAFARNDRASLASALSKLTGRAFAEDQAVVVKATSFVSEAAPLLVGAGMPALFIFTSPRVYVRTILAGPNSVKELRALDANRRRRLADRGINFPSVPHSDAYLAAVAWACEMTALETAQDAIGNEFICWLDFEEFLATPTVGLALAAAHLKLTLSDREVGEALAGPIMRRYSKAMEYDYSPALRADLLAEAGRTHAREIDAALAMLAEVARDAPLLKRAIGRTESV